MALGYVDETGFHYPDYPTVLEYYKNQYRAIYGQDVYLEPDSQDGQWLAIIARSAFDAYSVAAAAYNSFSPLTAQGDALSRNVKINGIARLVASYSTADLTIIGAPGAVITNGQAEDTLGQKWVLPASVTIPVDGLIIITANAATIGAVSAAADTINKIATPTLGWQSVNNVAAATPGDPVESDAELRIRQSRSTMIPSLSVMEGIEGGIASLPGVNRVRGYENDSSATDVNGLPAHSITFVVEGGLTQDIALVIAAKKTPGTPTTGTTVFTTTDDNGIPNVIRFHRPVVEEITVEVSLKALPGFSSATTELIKSAIADHINALDIGDDIYVSKLYVPANLGNPDIANTFNITRIRVRTNAGSLSTNDLALMFNAIAVCTPASVLVLVT